MDPNRRTSVPTVPMMTHHPGLGFPPEHERRTSNAPLVGLDSLPSLGGGVPSFAAQQYLAGNNRAPAQNIMPGPMPGAAPNLMAYPTSSNGLPPGLAAVHLDSLTGGGAQQQLNAHRSSSTRSSTSSPPNGTVPTAAKEIDKADAHKASEMRSRNKYVVPLSSRVSLAACASRPRTPLALPEAPNT